MTSGFYLSARVKWICLLIVTNLYGSQHNAANRQRPVKSWNHTINLLKIGAAGVGGNDTVVFQKALDQCSKERAILQIPLSRRPYRTGPLRIPSNSRIIFDSGVVLKALPGYSEYQRLINIVDVHDIEISGYGATLQMNNDGDKSSEYRHCIYISGASNVRLTGVKCADAGGDGIYISGSEAKPYSDDIVIQNVSADRSRRQGLSIVSAKNVLVRRCQFTRSKGINPQSGIDIEPNQVADHLENIYIEDSLTEENAGEGIRIGLSRLTDKSVDVSITIERHHDKSSGDSSLLGTDETRGVHDVRGHVFIDQFSSQNARMYGTIFSFWNSSGPKVVLQDLSVVNANQARATEDNAAIAVKRGGGGVGTIGNIEFVRPSITDTHKIPTIDYYFTFVDYSKVGIQKVEVSHPVLLRGARHQHPIGLFQGRGVETITDANESHLPAAPTNGRKSPERHAGALRATK